MAALPGGGFIVTWEELASLAGDFDADSVRAQRFDGNGVPVGDIFVVHTSSLNDQGTPAIASHARRALPDRVGGRQPAEHDRPLQQGIKGQNFRLPDTAGVLGETINGTADDDILTGTSLNETINGLDGDDFIRARGGNDTVNGGLGEDILRGQSGDDTVNGGAGDDLLRGDAGIDILRGGSRRRPPRWRLAERPTVRRLRR